MYSRITNAVLVSGTPVVSKTVCQFRQRASPVIVNNTQRTLRSGTQISFSIQQKKEKKERVGVVVCSRSSGQDTNAGIEVIEDNGILIGSVGLFMLWGGLLSYALLLSPNQVPAFDSYLLRKFLNLEDDGVSINVVFTSLFYVMGLWPLMYTALLIPAAKTKSVKVMPFVALSYGIGAFGLLPFMALWKPDGSVKELPPRKEDMEGLQNSITRGMESPFVAWGILAGTLFCLGNAAFADSQQWSDYVTLFWMSRFVHVTTIDFLTLSILAPFWMDNDAKLRNWKGRDSGILLPLLSCLPVLGPAIYLVLRPKSE
jgi:hypothetical protein